jgi:hypothetical protein
MKKAQAGSGRRRAFAIISTLLVIAILTVIVVAFLQSMRIDRLTSSAYLNKAKAEMAAEAALAAGERLLSDLISANPDSVTAWENQNGSSYTVLYYKRGTSSGTINGTPIPAAGAGLDPDAAVYYIPLVSGATAVPAANKANALPAMSLSNSIDINAVDSGSGTPWVGKYPGATSPELEVPWVLLNNENGKAIARYAFWIEDESFKINVNHAGSTVRGGSTSGNDPAQIPLQGILQILKNSAGAPYSGMDQDAFAAQIYKFREGIHATLAFFDPGQVNRTSAAYPDLYEDWKYLASLDSGSSNLSRHGSKRVDLNTVVQESTVPADIRQQLSRITKTIDYHLPSFGQRFYRTGNQENPDLNAFQVGTASVSSLNGSHEDIYLEKIAANIRDIIDTDHQPTVVNNDSGHTVRLAGTAGDRAVGFPIASTSSGANDVLAFGKENVPFLQEYALRARLVSMNPNRRSGGAPASATYEIFMDHYFEFWNMGTKDIGAEDLGPGAFLKVYAQPGYDTAGGTLISEGRDFTIPLEDFVDGNGGELVFRAGQATVLTTDSNPSSQLCPNVSEVYRPRSPNQYQDIDGNDYRRYTGNTFLFASPSSSGWFRVNILPRSTSQTDYETEVLLGNGQGLIESFCALPIPANLSINAENNAITQPDSYFFRGGSLRGNSSNRNQLADPRTNNEQLFIQRYRSVGDEDQTRYYNNSLNNNAVPAGSNFGNPINGFTDLRIWPDVDANNAAYTASNVGAISYFPDRDLQSIGELGHVMDPARGINASAGGIDYSRGGGRTLRVGQSETRSANANGLWDGARTSASYEWTSWRLADLFAIQSDLRLPGRINPNGVLRDNGAALKALLHQFSFGPAPETGSNFQDKPLLVDNVADAFLNRVAPVSAGSRTVNENTVFWERGAISELSLFNTGSNLASGANVANALDRVREEVIRRMVEMICTRGDTFTIYAVGQSVQELPSGDLRPLGIQYYKRTIRLNPVFNAALDDNFNPSDASAVSQRFRRPDSYEIEIIR